MANQSFGGGGNQVLIMANQSFGGRRQPGTNNGQPELWGGRQPGTNNGMGQVVSTHCDTSEISQFSSERDELELWD